MDATTTISNLINGFSDQVSQVTNQVSEKMPQSKNFFELINTKINWAHPTWDLIIYLFLAIFIIFYVFAFAREKVTATLISTYLSLAIVNSVPFLEQISQRMMQSGLFAVRTIIFFVAFLLLFFLLLRSNVLESFTNHYSSLWRILLFSFLQAGLFVSIILSFLPVDALNYLSFFTKIVFISDFGKFVWIILPIFALIFIRGEENNSLS